MKKLIFITSLFFQIISLFAESKRVANVLVNVTADDSIKSSIESLLKDKLRSLGDVKVVEPALFLLSDWIISVIGKEVTAKSGINTGTLALSITFTSRPPVREMKEKLDNDMIKFLDYFKERFGPYEYSDIKASLWLVYTDAFKLLNDYTFLHRDHLLFINDAGNIIQMCEKIIAYFDTKILEPLR